jgi:hypothetical protein
MSYKTKLKNSGKPADTDKIVFDAINYLACFLIVILSAFACVIPSYFGTQKQSLIIYGFVNSFLIIALIFLCVAFW